MWYLFKFNLLKVGKWPFKMGPRDTAPQLSLFPLLITQEQRHHGKARLSLSLRDLLQLFPLFNVSTVCDSPPSIVVGRRLISLWLDVPNQIPFLCFLCRILVLAWSGLYSMEEILISLMVESCSSEPWGNGCDLSHSGNTVEAQCSQMHVALIISREIRFCVY